MKEQGVKIRMKNEKTIIDEWEEITTPSIPEIGKISVNPKNTALLVLDIQKNNCNEDRRPRCVKQLPKMVQLIERAREKGFAVIFSLTSSATVKDIRKEVTPLEEEPIVQASVDKFYNTELETILSKKGITTVIIIGTSAHGAVLHTATGAAMRKLKVIVPIDGLSASDAYAEQYTIWHLANGPGTKRSVTLTTIDWLLNDE
jgi:nicotinamidase-related amidase